MWGDSTAQYPAVSGNLFQFGIDVDYQYLQKKVEMNPAIDVFLAEERLRDSEIRLAKTESTSDIRWSIGVKRFQETSDTALTAGVSMPLFSQKRNTGAVSSALASRNIVRFQKDIALINMRTQLFRAYSHRQQAILSANTLKDKIVPELKEALRETQIAYIRGRYSYLDYVAARQELLDARRMLIDAAATALSYGIEIEQLTAEPLSNSDHNDRFLTED
jgi:cobalt-zinc-cadmium efflux system outer membrane protein